MTTPKITLSPPPLPSITVTPPPETGWTPPPPPRLSSLPQTSSKDVKPKKLKKSKKKRKQSSSLSSDDDVSRGPSCPPNTQIVICHPGKNPPQQQGGYGARMGPMCLKCNCPKPPDGGQSPKEGTDLYNMCVQQCWGRQGGHRDVGQTRVMGPPPQPMRLSTQVCMSCQKKSKKENQTVQINCHCCSCGTESKTTRKPEGLTIPAAQQFLVLLQAYGLGTALIKDRYRRKELPLSDDQARGEEQAMNDDRSKREEEALIKDQSKGEEQAMNDDRSKREEEALIKDQSKGEEQYAREEEEPIPPIQPCPPSRSLRPITKKQ